MKDAAATQYMPLELYEKAYKKQYVENNISEACDLYKTIIREFPDSNECAYATIQLQKIQAAHVAGTLDLGRRPPSMAAVIAVVLSLCSVICLGAGGTCVIIILNQKLTYLSTIAQVIGAMELERTDEALELLDELKFKSTDMLLPFDLAADIYLKRNEFDKARNEYLLFQRLNPKSLVPQVKLKRIEVLEEQQTRKRPSDLSTGTKSPLPPPTGVAPIDQSATAKTKPDSRAESSKTKPRYIIPTDSLSYF